MRKILVSALAAAVLVVLFASAQGTAALWRAENRINPGTITTGSLSLAVGDGTSGSEDFIFKDLNTSTLAPGGFVQAPLTISNTGTAALSYTLVGTTSTTTPQGAADVELAAAVVLSVNAAPCAAGSPNPATSVYEGQLNGNVASAAMKLEPAESEVLCVRIALPASATQAAAAGKMKLVLSWRGDQL